MSSEQQLSILPVCSRVDSSESEAATKAAGNRPNASQISNSERTHRIDVRPLQSGLKQHQEPQKQNQKQQQEQFKYMEQYEQQDQLIQDGISLLCNKVMECLELLFQDNHDRDACCKMSREWQVKHHGWQDKLFEMHGRLSGWELQHCDGQTFSLAFEPLITFLMMNKAVKQRTLIASKELLHNNNNTDSKSGNLCNNQNNPQHLAISSSYLLASNPSGKGTDYHNPNNQSRQQYSKLHNATAQPAKEDQRSLQISRVYNQPNTSQLQSQQLIQPEENEYDVKSFRDQTPKPNSQRNNSRTVPRKTENTTKITSREVSLRVSPRNANETHLLESSHNADDILTLPSIQNAAGKTQINPRNVVLNIPSSIGSTPHRTARSRQTNDNGFARNTNDLFVRQRKSQEDAFEPVLSSKDDKTRDYQLPKTQTTAQKRLQRLQQSLEPKKETDPSGKAEPQSILLTQSKDRNADLHPRFMTERTYNEQEQDYQFKEGTDWNLLASNGGLGTVDRPKPFEPKREYETAPSIAPEFSKTNDYYSRTIDVGNAGASNMKASLTPNGKKPSRNVTVGMSARQLLQHQPAGTSNFAPQLSSAAKYAKILRQQIDHIGGRRDRANFQTRRLHKAPSANHYLF